MAAGRPPFHRTAAPAAATAASQHSAGTVCEIYRYFWSLTTFLIKIWSGMVTQKVVWYLCNLIVPVPKLLDCFRLIVVRRPPGLNSRQAGAAPQRLDI